MIIDNMTCPNGYCHGTLFVNNDDGELEAKCHLCGRSWTMNRLAELRKEKVTEIKKQEGEMVKGSKYDHLAQQVTEDLKTMSHSQVERKHNIPRNTLGKILGSWQKRGILSAITKTPPVITKKHPAITKTTVKPTVIPAKEALPQVVEKDNSLIPAGIDTFSFAIGYRTAVLDILGGKH